MRAFDYLGPKSEGQALAALAAPGSRAIGGGTEMLNWIRLGIAAPDRLVDLGKLPGWRGISSARGWIRIGAGTTLADIGADVRITRDAASLAEACLKAASAQVRNRATIGGNLLQKTRCAYFRAESPLPWACNKRLPGSGCAAIEGINERHALFGWTDACTAVQPSDPATALACLEAEIEIVSTSGRRRVAADDFHLTQADAGEGAAAAQRENRLRDGELIAAIHIPVRTLRRSAYVKVRERASYEYALVSAAAALEMENDRIAAACVVLGSVAQRPWRLRAAEAALVGKPLDRDVLLPVIEASLADARPLHHNGFKLVLARNAALRALLIAGGAA